ncbi:MAG: hypothetical protein M1819_000220 [Sarea resinae]|nr:MAG: hypothetical protein M1819_000220 [Sarea resinae]
MDDDPLDMEDLFGDAQQLHLNPAALPRGLLARLDELRLNGCCQKLAWSKMGCIAYTSRDGSRVVLRNLLCRPEDGKWTLSREFPVASTFQDGLQISHLMWNHNGTDLAVVDVYGRISVYSVYVAINRISVSRHSSAEQMDDLNAVTGMSWLSPDRLTPFYKPVEKREGSWKYSVTTYKPPGTHHPANKSALVAVTRDGTLRLLYQLPAPDSSWQEVNTELESIGSSKDLLTHASICSDRDGSLLLVTHNFSRSLRTYRVQVNWNLPPGQRHLPISLPLPTPSLIVHPIRFENHCSPQSGFAGGDGFRNFELVDNPAAQLSFLDFIPASPELNQRESKHPMIMAIFSYAPGPLDLQSSQEPFSIVSRWELCSSSQNLHQSFDQLASKKNSVGPLKEQSISLKRLEDFTIPKIVLSLQQLNLYTTIALAHSDGSIDFYDRESMNLITANEDWDTISSMSQAGFAFPVDDSCLHIALSPNTCLAVTRDADGDLRLKQMGYVLGPTGDSMDDPKFSAMIISLSLQFACSCTHSNNYDDILSIVQQYSTKNFDYEFLYYVYRSLSINVDYSIDPAHEKLFKNSMIQRCLSIQNSLGYKGAQKPRSLLGKIAWVTLNLRFTSLTFAFSFNNFKGAGPGHENDVLRPDALLSLLGVVKWSIDVMNFLVDELFSLADAVKGHAGDRSYVEGEVSKMNSPALYLVLASVPRVFLRYNCRCLRGLMGNAQKGFQAGVEGEQRRVFKSLANVIEGSMVKVSQFERILGEIDHDIRGAYQHSSISDADRALAEKSLLYNGDIPEALAPVLERLLTTMLNKLRNEVDPADLYFANHSWLGLIDDEETRDYRRRHVVDAVKKVPLPKGTRLRRCTRCCSYMEDIMGHIGMTVWMSSMHRMCLCGSLWMLDDSRG